MPNPTDPSAAQFGPLINGLFSGRQQKLYADKLLMTGGYDDTPASALEDAAWFEIEHRNLSYNDGGSLGTTQIGNFEFSTQGFDKFTLTWELVRSRGVDAVYDRLKTEQAAGKIVRLMILNNDLAVAGASGVIIPALLGETPTSGSGADAVVTTFNAGMTRAIDKDGNLETYSRVIVGTAGTALVDPAA